MASYETTAFWDSFQAGYDRLADNAEEWAQIEAERAGEDPALADDLDRS